MGKFNNLLIIFALFLSGICGISYEVVYARLLSNLFGNHLIIYSSILVTFLFGIAIGSKFAHRFNTRLWAVEFLIGIYAYLLISNIAAIDHLLYNYLSGLVNNLYFSGFISLLLLLIPATLIGASVPLFTSILKQLNLKSNFSLVYLFYNLAGALTAIIIELYLLRLYGLKSSITILSTINIVVALLLYALKLPIPPSNQKATRESLTKFGGWHSLFLVSMLSGIYQIVLVAVAQCLLGPFNETFAIALAITLLSITIGTFIVGLLDINFKAVLLLAAAAIIIPLLCQEPFIRIYAVLYEQYHTNGLLLFLIKFILIFAFFGVGSIFLGATIPALIGDSCAGAVSGYAISISALGNVAGYLLMTLIIHHFLPYGFTLLFIASALVAILIVTGRNTIWQTNLGAFVVLLLIISFKFVWEERLLLLGFRNFQRMESFLNYKKNLKHVISFKDAKDLVSIIEIDHTSYYFINGYISNPLDSPGEVVVGALSAGFAPRLDRALVLGMGSGATAGTVALFFNQLDVVEISPAVLNNTNYLNKYNFNIDSRANVNTHQDDGIHYLKSSNNHYSLILNTVTSPLYFSSSKLYTKDFFKLVKSRLSADGVYSTWVDNRIGDAGLNTILATLKQSFNYCGLSYIRSGYFLLTCSDKKLNFAQGETVAANKDLEKYLFVDHQFNLSQLKYSLLSFDILDGLKTSASINTLDLPHIEYLMAKLDPSDMPRFKKSLVNYIDPKELNTNLAPDWDPIEFLITLDQRTSSKSSMNKSIRKRILDIFPNALN